MIRKYQFGRPIRTDAAAADLPAEKGTLPYLQYMDGKQFAYGMGDKDIVYGLGENVRGINKRGWIYESNCTDGPSHTEDRRSLYAAHNFLLVHGEATFGIFFDYPGMLTFDIGYTNLNEMVITPADMNMDIYVVEGPDMPSIIKEFRSLIGRSYIPPKWAFGYGQSRWSYMDEDEVREVVRNYRESGIPLDSIYLDIDYMDRYKDFTVNEDAFPDLPAFVTELKAQGVRLVPIIDAGVKIEKGYDVYEEGVRNGYFCKEEDGTDFVAAVWPGKVHFPDVLNADARKWFGHLYKYMLDQGIEGFWNDMNEPAIFYSEKHLKEVFEQIDGFKGRNLDLNEFWQFKGLVENISNNEGDYRSFYHNVDGELIRHDKVHNLFGYNMTRAAGEAFEELEPDKRILMFSRSSYIGMHRYGGIWMGDNISWWSHLLLNLKMLPSLNMCGILYTGADICGFGGDTTEDLALRWIALGIFTPLMRNHSALGTRRQEAYRFEHTDAFRNLIGIRYGLMPYLYSEYMKAALRNEMLFKPLSFDYPDDSFALQVEDQLMLGGSIMIAPVYQQNAEGRYVYLPETMKMVKIRSMDDMSFEIMEKGHHYIPVALHEVIFFIRPGKIVPFTEPAKCISDLDDRNLRYMHFLKGEGSYELYRDDGFSRDYDNPSNYTVITLEAE